MKSLPIRMIVQLPRVGGTLLSRLIGAQNCCYLFSEVHPTRQGADLRKQALDYHGLSVSGQARDYVAVLREIVANADKPVVLRDHTHLNFTRERDNCYRLENYDAVKRCFDVRPLALFRHPADQYLSCLSRTGMSKYMTPALFATGYVNFFRAAAAFPWVRYEDLVAKPKEILGPIAMALDLKLDAACLSGFADFHDTTGDGDQASRGYALSEVAELPRRDGVLAACADLAAEPGMTEVCRALDYDL